MKQFIKTPAFVFLVTMLAVPFIGTACSHASTKVTIQDNRVRVQENGVTKEYGTVRDTKTTSSGVEVYTNRNFNGPAVTLNKNGSITTKETNSSRTKECTYGCVLIIDGDEDETE